MENQKHSWQDIGGFFVDIDETHRFGTDAVLLENFTAALRKETVLEIGTGCGIIPLLMCKNGRAKFIYAVDIQYSAIELVNNAIEKNNIDKIEAICADAKEYKAFEEKIGIEKLDLIVCNPPYYKENSGAKCIDDERAVCREESSLTVYDVAAFSERFLKFGGRLCICNKPQRLCDCIDAMRKYKIEPKRIRFVQKDEKSSPWLVLIEGKKGAKPFVEIAPPLVMNSKSGDEEILRIYGDIKQKQE